MPKPNESVTGRDGYIIAKALAYAFSTIERLPPRWQERSDMEDMKKMFENVCPDPSMRANLIGKADHHLSGAAKEAA